MLRQLTLWELIFIVALCVFAMSTARAALVCGNDNRNEDGVSRMGDSADVMVQVDTDGAGYWYGQDHELIYIRKAVGGPRMRNANHVAGENVIFWVGDDPPYSSGCTV